MATRTLTGTAAADLLGITSGGQPRSGDIWVVNGLAGADTLVLNNNGQTKYNTGFVSTGFTIGAADASGMVTVSGASSGGTTLTFKLTSVESIAFYDKTVTVAYADTTPPVFVSAAVNGSSLVMTYTEATTLDATNIPAATAFTVSGGHAVSLVAVNAAAKTVTLTLATAVAYGESVTVAYTDPTANNDTLAIQDAAGNDAATIAATAVTNNTPLPANHVHTGTVTISGSPIQGQTLTAVSTLADADGIPATGAGAIAYQWAAGGTAIAGATGTSYVLTAAELGKTITVTASYTDLLGYAETQPSAATGVVTVVPNNSPTGAVSIGGTPTQGQTLTATNTLADADGIPATGAGAIAYQWAAAGTAIAGATGSSLVLAQAQVGKAITVTASYTDLLGHAESVASSATAGVANINDAPTGSVTISGTAATGQTLTAANTLADADGLGTISYQWYAAGTVISGATASTYLLTTAETNKIITVKANYTDGYGTAESVASAATAPVFTNSAPTGTVAITGTPTQGQTLTESHATLADADGLGAIALQWYADNTAITGATSNTFTLTESEVGKAITVKASYTDGHSTPESVTSSPTGAVVNVNDNPTGSVTVTGTATQGQTLTESHATLADADGLGTISLQWYADSTAITGATASTYHLTASEVGKTITVHASYTDGHGTGESVSSIATAAVVADTTAPTVTAFNPLDAATGVALNSDIVVTFSEAIVRGAGTIELHTVSETGTTVASTTAGTLVATVSGTTLTINPTADLTNSTHYYLTFGQGAVDDLAGNHYAGTTAYDFFSVDPAVAGSSSSSAVPIVAGVAGLGLLAWAIL